MTTHNGSANLQPDRGGILSDVQSIRQRARQRIEDAHAGSTSTSAHDAVLHRLKESLTAQLVGALRYRRGLALAAIKRELHFLAQREQQPTNHAAVRMVQPGDEPTPASEAADGRSNLALEGGSALERMIQEDLAAERIAIECYREVIGYLQEGNHASRRLLEGVMALQEEHAAELSRMLDDLRRLATGRFRDMNWQQHATGGRPARVRQI